ncbi:beta-N-acetylhexosaminidase [Burkholderia vietnamiensis]|uniref:beta-N-acetylhexosaminidase n=4 Tax=Burkholderia vietnamiensis TaxID=60552 RepID=A0AAW7TAL0_BURVI|nr:family 20 glycosylhydrolase [Burkholderia vietnamiensis]KKI39015.1 beta-N-acetylhexosaminidase [Burkholderia vietnamiensis]MBR7913300.1 carbohydate-binding domain-containing protein [Burkholderia vietnamiensis]MDN7798886.1 family 20 glycosylhydrolase [Burkholderia vietnamiensis]HDR9188491.1 carbohydate-binding domain-containing protein [Burkholderia vietnamiensis]HDR9275761.1 carbohydate-binding domain-containing protein [Burkholderia vietnamiensis]
MKRPLPFLFAGVLIAALLPSASRAEPVPAGAGSVAASVVVPAAGIARPAMQPADLAALLSNGLALRVAVDNNHAAATGVPCADLGADGAACATGRLFLQNRGHRPIADGGWKLYLHSIRRLLRIDRPGFALRRLTGDLYELTPQPGSLRLAPGERIALPFVAEYWLRRYSDVIPRPYVVVDGAPPTVLRYNDTDDELRYVESLPADAQNSSTGNAPPVAARPDASRALPSVKREQRLPGALELRGVELVLPELPDAQVAALRERAATLGLDGARARVRGVVAPRRLPADIATPGGYRLAIGPRGVLVEGYDRAGLYYGVQTLFSLAPAGGGPVPALLVEDAPRFTHRGMHVDLARNFKHPATLRRLIDQMSAYKLNRLHLHLSDDEGWRIEIPGLPELTDIGARRCHDPSETRCLLPQLGSGPDNRSGGGYLTRADYVALVRYAADRFVEVIPEIDMPAHARAAVVSMEARYRRLHAAGRDQEANAYRLLDPQDTSNLTTVQFYDRRSDLNPCVPGALNFASKVIREIAAMHADAQAPLRIWHFGGDEAKNILLGGGFQPLNGTDPNKGRIDLAAQDKPWARSPACAALLQGGEIRSIDELPTRFAKQVSAAVDANGIDTMAAWQDGIKHASGPRDFSTRHVMVSLWDTIFWGAADSARDLSNAGYLTVLALPDYLYFDFPYTLNPRERGYYWGSQATDEYKVFSLAPENLPQNAEVMGDRDGNAFEATGTGPAPRIEGIQGQAWGEVMRNDTFLEYMVYPRLLALAERAWHRADWELPYAAGVRYKRGDTHHVDTAALQRDWAGFATLVVQRELPKLDRAGIGYRKPSFTVTNP